MPASLISPLANAPQLSLAETRAEMGDRAANHAVRILQGVLSRQPRARVMFACAPSQDEFLAALVTRSRDAIDWSRVTAFHMDEYVGLPADHPACFRQYLRSHLLNHLPSLTAFELIRGESSDTEAECARYAALLDEAPLDLICLGIGENGHIAFNDPPVADFADRHAIKVVQLDLACRQQQVNDGCFPTLADVPTHALTVTIPVFRRAHALSVVVPGPRKAAAVRATLQDNIGTACPATIPRTHPNATLFIDRASASALG